MNMELIRASNLSRAIELVREEIRMGWLERLDVLPRVISYARKMTDFEAGLLDDKSSREFRSHLRQYPKDLPATASEGKGDDK